MTETDSFIPGGFESFPSLYADTKQVAEFSTWSTEVLEERVNQYGHFLSTPQMPRATETANRILDHLLFELAYRDGIYDEYTGKQEDELCQ
jgi:hypothetical protein